MRTAKFQRLFGVCFRDVSAVEGTGNVVEGQMGAAPLLVPPSTSTLRSICLRNMATCILTLRGRVRLRRCQVCFLSN